MTDIIKFGTMWVDLDKYKEEKLTIFIPGNCPSSKNSKIKTSKGIFHSKTVMKYLRELGIQGYSTSKKTVKEYKTRPNLFKKCFTQEFIDALKTDEKPVKLGFLFIRDSKRKADFHNLVQLPLDLMTAHGFIEDDDMDNILPYPIDNGYIVDKENTGVIIRILKK